MTGDNKYQATSTLGVTPDNLTVRDLSIAHGTAFTQKDIESSNQVALLRKTVADNLFPSRDRVGQVIRINNVLLAASYGRDRVKPGSGRPHLRYPASVPG